MKKKSIEKKFTRLAEVAEQQKAIMKALRHKLRCVLLLMQHKNGTAPEGVETETIDAIQTPLAPSAKARSDWISVVSMVSLLMPGEQNMLSDWATGAYDKKRKNGSISFWLPGS